MVFFLFSQIFIEHSAANFGDPDQTPLIMASDLCLHCLSMFHKKDVRLIYNASLSAQG